MVIEIKTYIKKLNSKPIYKKRVVAFIDILGFECLIKDTEANNVFDKSGSIEMVLVALAILKEEELSVTHGKRVSLFSDSLVISYPINTSSLAFLLRDILGFSYKLIKENVLIRGGVTIGTLYHSDDGTVFGQGMNIAYKLESECAIYPRIILDEKTYKVFKDHLSHKETSIFSWLKKDFDGFYYFDILRACKEEFENDKTYPLFLDNLKKFIAEKLKDEDTKVRQKYCWLQNKVDKL